jgi:hypothetical protein
VGPVGATERSRPRAGWSSSVETTDRVVELRRDHGPGGRAPVETTNRVVELRRDHGPGGRAPSRPRTGWSSPSRPRTGWSSSVETTNRVVWQPGAWTSVSRDVTMGAEVEARPQGTHLAAALSEPLTSVRDFTGVLARRHADGSRFMASLREPRARWRRAPPSATTSPGRRSGRRTLSVHGRRREGPSAAGRGGGAAGRTPRLRRTA